MDAAQDQKDPAEADKENEQNGKGLREQQLPPSPEARIPSPTSASEMMTSGDAPSEEPSYGAKSHRELEIVTDYGDTVEPKEEGEEEEDDASPGAEDIGSKSPNTAKTLFWKQLTSSDSNGTGRVVIPKAAAEEHFPRVSSTHGIKLVFLDTFGDKHALQLRFGRLMLSGCFSLKTMIQLSVTFAPSMNTGFGKTNRAKSTCWRAQHPSSDDTSCPKATQ